VNAYVDSSVILGVVFGERNRLLAFERFENTVASVVMFVECRRAIDRARLAPATARKTIGTPQSRFLQAVERIEFIELDHNIVAIAAQPFGFAIKSLDAVHLATAIDWRQRVNQDLLFATHDLRLAAAARRVGFPVVGV
jgi:predicted nucleic acid-binding protein